MKNQIELNPGEIKITINEAIKGKVFLSDLGLKSSDLELESGNMRFVIDLTNLSELNFTAVPTIDFQYTEDMTETHWVSEFNGETISDKLDHHGRATVILMNRKKIEDKVQRHENILIVHADFPAAVTIDASTSCISLF